jgi:hypothetical protein
MVDEMAPGAHEVYAIRNSTPMEGVSGELLGDEEEKWMGTFATLTLAQFFASHLSAEQAAHPETVMFHRLAVRPI